MLARPTLVELVETSRFRCVGLDGLDQQNPEISHGLGGFAASYPREPRHIFHNEVEKRSSLARVTSFPVGPQPTRTDRPRAAALRVLRALTELDQPALLQSLVDALGGHPNSVRAQLDQLVEAGFVEPVSSVVIGRGRPPKRFEVTIAGRQVALEDPERDDYLSFIEAVAEDLAERPDSQGLASELGRRWGRRMRDSRGDDLDLVDILANHGFTPMPTEDGLVLRTCPLLALGGRRPDVICTIHGGLLDTLTDGQATLTPFVGHGCAVTMVDPQGPPAESAPGLDSARPTPTAHTSRKR